MKPELRALQASLFDWAERTGVIPTVRSMEQRQAPAGKSGVSPDLSVLKIVGPHDVPDLGTEGAAAAVEQMAASLVPGPVMPTLLAALLGVTDAETAAVGLVPGTLTGTTRVTGETGPVLGASAETTLVLGTAEGAWFRVAPGTPGVSVTPLDALDFSRELATVRLDDVPAEPLPGLTTERVRDHAAILFAAEAAGVAAWCSATATAYAKTRKQFGQLIGEFQAVKHLCAWMHCRAERAGAVAWDAARSAEERRPPVGVALDDAVENAKDCIQVLGGIGFTWEHDAHLYLRRAVSLRALAPGQGVRGKGFPRSRGASGGRPPESQGIGLWAIPAIRAHGTQAQQDRFVGADVVWCQLFSEPEAGSDLAGLRTRAVKTDGGWRLTGQKVWTSLARDADWAICLARTDPDVPKHKGLSYFLVDMHSAGIDIRPLREITGRAVFNEVFLDDVFVADDCLVGQPGDGWRIAMSTLGTERETLGGGGGDILAERGVHPAVRKLLGVEDRQAEAEQALTALGPDGAAASPESFEFLLTRCLSIAGGTTQVLLNQVAERVLGLPR